VASRRQQRKREKARRHELRAAAAPFPEGDVVAPVERLLYTREEAAEALGISLATLDRRVIPAISTVKTEWGARLIPRSELHRFSEERLDPPRAPRRPKPTGRKSALPVDVVERIRREHATGTPLAEIARRLNREKVPTGQGGRQWWPSTVRVVVSSPPRQPASRMG
jgi:hypothetical protein